MQRWLASTLLIVFWFALSLGAIEGALLVLAGFTQADSSGSVFR